MNKVLFFSGSTITEDLAIQIAKYLGFEINDLTSFVDRESFDYSKKIDNLVFCFPVYSQNIARPIKEILKKLQAKNIIIIATYGKKGTGNVLYVASQLIKGNIIGGAYVPTKHTYLDEELFSEFDLLKNLLDKFKSNTQEVVFPKRKKHLFANFFPEVRSRLGVKITRSNKCISCSICDSVCPMLAIENGRIKDNCIRCLRCVVFCPTNALEVKIKKPLYKYLQKNMFDELIIYK